MKKLLVTAAFLLTAAGAAPAGLVSAQNNNNNDRNNNNYYTRDYDNWNDRNGEDRRYYEGWDRRNGNNGRNYPSNGPCNYFWRSEYWRYDGRQYITERLAEQIARCVFPYRGVVDTDLRQRNNGVRVFEVRFNNGYRVDVRASDGRILRVYDGWNNGYNRNNNHDRHNNYNYNRNNYND